MLDLGLLGFAHPWLLAALVALPALWWLLRIIPPAPRLVRFPAVRFLLGLEPEEQTSARTPLWLLILRLALAALLILALAGPILNPEPELSGRDPLVLVVDDGWAAAPNWPARTEALERFAGRALRENREVVLVGTAPDPVAPTFHRISAADAMPNIDAWQPKSWPSDRQIALERLRAEGLEGAEFVWLADGIAESEEAAAAARTLAEGLQELGSLTVFAEPPEERAPLLLPPTTDEAILTVAARRPAAGEMRSVMVRALGPEGEVLARQTLVFEGAAARAEVGFELPLELRNQIARLELEGARGVGGVVLLDERWRRRAVGLAGVTTDQIPQPLLSELYYVERALSPYADLRRGDLADLIDMDLSAIVVTDSVQIDPGMRSRLAAWVEQGGVLLRFAGPRLANAGPAETDLVPVLLRHGDRHLDGALSWARPLPLASFNERGPLASLSVPADDVSVRRQVLAQPGPTLAARSWARLSDGTPLITGAARSEGWLVLVHTTANTTWSSLPLSGVFVDILRQIVNLGPGAGGAPDGLLAPLEVLDGNGHLVAPGAATQPVAAEALPETVASARHPPGLYGRIDAAEDAPREVLNLASAVPDLRSLTMAEFGVAPRPFAGSAELDLMPWLLAAALALALLDMIIGLWLRGLVVRSPAAGAAALAAVLLAGSAAMAPTARAQEAGDEPIIAATGETRLAYVLTGLSEVDAVSRAGLEGLSLVLNRRTAVEAGDPLPVDLGHDDLNLYPLLYWPIPSDHPDLPTDVPQRLDRYLRQGGMILFDTGDAGTMIPGQGQPGGGELRLRQLLEGINLPPLRPVPEDHPLTRSFYLLQEFPGRYTGQPVWVDQPEASVNDGVSQIIIGSHDWAAAWAIDELGMSMYPVVPGGERQREMARRVGINLVMYALTGNYKTDQVHIPALLERLGQ
jgi:hypothetical protein